MADEKPDFAPAFRRGIEHFNSLQFWEAHESWEELWLVAESEIEQFLQGLIQVAAAYHHVKRGTLRGAVRLFDAGLARLARFPDGFCGLDRARTEEAALRHRSWAAERLARGEDAAALVEPDYPKLEIVDGSAIPDHGNW